jgi:excinuclease ABC subunit B
LVFDIKNLLLRFGIVSRMRRKKIRYRDAKGNITPKKYCELTISGRDNLLKFKNSISFSLTYKSHALEATIADKTNTNVDLFPGCSRFVRDLRLTLGLSQRKLAERIGCNRSHVSMIEHCKRLPSKRLFRRIIDLTNDRRRLNNLLEFNLRRIVKIGKVKPTNGYLYDIGVVGNQNFTAGFGNIFVHNTFVVASVVQNVQKPTLVISHNKTLAAQLCSEFRAFFPKNAVEYFVSYYDYFQPEAYIPEPDLYIEKDSSINQEIDRLRHRATQALLTRRDVIIVASVSCIYGLGSPEQYKAMSLILRKGEKIDRDSLLRRLVEMQYERNDMSLSRGRFRARGDTIEICTADEENIVRIELLDDVVDKISHIDHVTGNTLDELDGTLIFPARHYVVPKETMDRSLHDIEQEMIERVDELRKAGKLVEAQRLEQRTKYDLEMISQVGYVTGIENYDRYFDARKPGQPPFTLLDFFPKDFLTVIDESHVTIPQLQGMYYGDRSRKKNLIDYGFRLPSAYDHRPLFFNEFEQHMNQVIYASATPALYELQKSQKVVEQLIRPTGLVDPEIIVRPTKGQVDDLLAEIRKRVKKSERVLVTTLTKRMAEDLTEYLQPLGIKVQYLHSEVETLKRTEILRDLRIGEYDVIVGVNLLREGLDLPEVSLVAILDADKESFLRSDVALIQTMGRAARNVFGQVIMYADEITESMKRAIGETERRRKVQLEYNKEHEVTPQTVRKEVRALLESPAKIAEASTAFTETKGYRQYSKDKIDIIIANLEEEMLIAAQKLEFERAAKIRDRIRELKEARDEHKENIRERLESKKPFI